MCRESGYVDGCDYFQLDVHYKYFQLGVHYEYVLETSSFGFSNLRYYLCVRHNVDTGCDVSRCVHIFGAMQITRELCFDEGGMMMSFRE